MQYKVYTHLFIRRQKLDKEELIRLYFNDWEINLTDDTFELESDDIEEAEAEYESLKKSLNMTAIIWATDMLS